MPYQKELRVATSEQLYTMWEKEINNLLKALKLDLKKHKQKHLKDPKNYGYAGDLSYVSEKLSEIEERFPSTARPARN